MEDRIKRHSILSKKMLTLSKKLLDEGSEFKDIKVTNLAIMFLIINGTLLDKKSFNKLYNQMKLFSNAELFETLMQTDLKNSILDTIKGLSIEDDELEDSLNSVAKELDSELNFEMCLCGINDIQPYDGNKYKEHIGFCLNCGGKIE